MSKALTVRIPFEPSYRAGGMDCISASKLQPDMTYDVSHSSFEKIRVYLK